MVEVVGEGLPLGGGPVVGAGVPGFGEGDEVVDVDVGGGVPGGAVVGEYQLPLVAAQEESVTTLEPSRLRTVSRVLQVPLMVIQWGNRSRL